MRKSKGFFNLYRFQTQRFFCFLFAIIFFLVRILLQSINSITLIKWFIEVKKKESISIKIPPFIEIQGNILLLVP